MEQSEILAQLLGHSVEGVGDGNAAAVSAALIGLQTAGIGLGRGNTDFGLTYNTETGGTSVRLGRYLSPKLYLDYTVGLVEQLDLVTLSYQITPRWSFRTQLNDENMRTSINYRIETGHPLPDQE